MNKTHYNASKDLLYRERFPNNSIEIGISLKETSVAPRLVLCYIFNNNLFHWRFLSEYEVRILSIPEKHE